jgi:hypothetical protein
MDKIDKIGPTIVSTESGSKMWFLDGERHREDGPAVVLRNGHKVWYLHGKKHRTDGPAIEWNDGQLCWYLFGNCMSFDKWLSTNQTLSDEEKVMYKLQHG